MAVKKHRVHWDITAQDGSKQAFDAVERNLLRTKSAAVSMGQTFRAVLGATIFAGFSRESLQVAIEAEKASNRLNVALRGTGSAASTTRREIDELADSLSSSTLFDDEAVRNSAAELLKFGNIHGDVFRGALDLSTDLASFMGTDLPSAAQMIGRALQSPTEGLRMMEREFGKLTEAEEKHINTLVEQGRAVEAQNAVLELFRSKIGGAAREMNTGLTSASSGVAKAWDDMLEAWMRTDTVGGRVIRTMQGLASLMREIEGLVKKDEGAPNRALDAGLDRANTVIATLEKDLAERRAQRRAFGGPNVPDDPEFAKIQARIDALKEERRLLLSRVTGQREQTAFEESLATGGAGALRPPVVLGGKTSDEAAARREADFLAQKAQELDEMAAKDRLEASEALTKVEIAKEKRRQDELKRTIEVQVESAQVATDLAEELIYTWDAAGNRVEMTAEAFEAMTDAERRAQEAAQDLGLTFSSAFEDWIVDIDKASDGLKALEKDIIRIVARKAITEPLAGGISGVIDKVLKGGLGGVFGGGGAGADAGGASAEEMAALGIPFFAKGTDNVPRDGLAYLHKGEAVIPAGENRGSFTFAPQIYIDSRADRAAVAADVDRAMRASEARILRSFRSGGAFARAAGNA